MKVREILNLYDSLCFVAIIDYKDYCHLNLKVLWRGSYDRFHLDRIGYKELKKFLDCEVKHLSSYLNEKTDSLLQIYV